MVFLLFACASDEAAWAVNHASVVPSESGLSGTQTWEFFDKKWAKKHDPDHFLCARAQQLVGEVAAPPKGCEGCLAAYNIAFAEIESDCGEELATDAAYTGMLILAIGDVPEIYAEQDPHPGRSLGWYASFDGEIVQAFGFAWDEAFDYEGTPGPPGWHNDAAYTLWPAVAWDLGG